MRAVDLRNKRIAIWGLGHEGKAAGAFIRKILPTQPLTFIDEADGPDRIEGIPFDCPIIRGAGRIGKALDEADILIKSPGVSLYNPLVQRVKAKGAIVTSLLNLWFAEPHKAKTICVTGTKGKSTTSNLLAHTLNGLGKKTVLGGNIGVPIVEISGNDAEYAVIEVSSYQASDFTGTCDIAVLTSLHAEHLDWHGSAEQYYEDKFNLIARAKTKIVNFETYEFVREHVIMTDDVIPFNEKEKLHVEENAIYDGKKRIGELKNAHLARPHNLSNVCAVLTVLKFLGFTLPEALEVMESYRGLPHRQQELGEKDGVLYVNDSIATAPHAAIAALEVYHARPVTLIAGGYDRGVDYKPLIEHILKNGVHTVICLGPSGKRIHDGLVMRREERIFMAASMPEVVQIAKQNTPQGGVILLSPAAPSYGLFHDFVERGTVFAAECGFKLEAVK